MLDLSLQRVGVITIVIDGLAIVDCADAGSASLASSTLPQISLEAYIFWLYVSICNKILSHS